MKRKYLLLIPSVLIVLALGGYVYYLKTKTPVAVIPKTEEQLVGNDLDAHGCKASAGYSWCETKSKCLRVWEETCIEDPGALEAQVMADLVAKHGESIKQLAFSIAKIEGDYAQGGISGVGGGGMWFAAKVDGVWKLVWDGNGNIFCEDLKDYPNFPKDMIPECIDKTAGNLVTR
jgi:hypothetical protein